MSPHSTAPTSPIPSWQELIEREPRLLDLEAWCLLQPTCGREFWVMYSREFKPRLNRLVGWDVRDEFLRTHWAWMAAHSHLMDVLEGGR